jgi:hypothetical protein
LQCKEKVSKELGKSNSKTGISVRKLGKSVEIRKFSLEISRTGNKATKNTTLRKIRNKLGQSCAEFRLS